MRKGFQVFIFLIIFISAIPAPANAFRWEESPGWRNGMRVRVSIENVDYWITDVDFGIFVHLTLIEKGYVTDFLNLTFILYLQTEETLSRTTMLESHWDSPRDRIDISEQFRITSPMINHSAWDTYLGRCYYELNQSVIVNETYEQNCYTGIREANEINISTISYFVYWPYPPIILMGIFYWTLFLVIRRFNRRYIEVKAFEKEHPDEFKKQEYSW